MAATKSQRPVRNKPSLKHSKEDIITMNTLANKKNRKHSTHSTPKPKPQKRVSKSAPRIKKKPAAHTKAKVAAALSTILLYMYQTKTRKQTSKGGSSNHGPIKLRRF
jgi:hypothetical protein